MHSSLSSIDPSLHLHPSIPPSFRPFLPLPSLFPAPPPRSPPLLLLSLSALLVSLIGASLPPPPLLPLRIPLAVLGGPGRVGLRDQHSRARRPALQPQPAPRHATSPGTSPVCCQVRAVKTGREGFAGGRRCPVKPDDSQSILLEAFPEHTARIDHAHPCCRRYDGELLTMARDLGDRLLRAFDTQTGVRRARVVVKHSWYFRRRHNRLRQIYDPFS